jgi:hypothetical protein
MPLPPQIARLARSRRAWAIALIVLWALGYLDWTAWRTVPRALLSLPFAAGLAGAAILLFPLPASPLARRARLSLLAPIPLSCLTFALSLLPDPSLAKLSSGMSIAALFLLGLVWLVWWLERRAREDEATPLPSKLARWDPTRTVAWFYRRRSRRLDQSTVSLLAYVLLFVLVGSFLNQLSGCREIYESPAGGGEQAQLEQVVQIEQIIRKKLVINPLSAVIFNPPPIEEVRLQIEEITHHAYQVGQGSGEGAGFAAGTARGKVRFIRLEYEGGDWDQKFGIGADLNMLLEYGIRTGHPVAETTESRHIRQLNNFPRTQAPPLVYMTGQRNIVVPDRDVEILREYLTEKHGMILADNGGSLHWHGQFFDLMARVLPTIKPVRIPLDHPVHRIPYRIPFLPYVAPHGGREAWGWVLDGRLLCYYHPGDIGDGWADGHSGVPREIWEACYQLGTNIIFYAHAEHSRWAGAQDTSDD